MHLTEKDTEAQPQRAHHRGPVARRKHTCAELSEARTGRVSAAPSAWEPSPRSSFPCSVASYLAMLTGENVKERLEVYAVLPGDCLSIRYAS